MNEPCDVINKFFIKRALDGVKSVEFVEELNCLNVNPDSSAYENSVCLTFIYKPTKFYFISRAWSPFSSQKCRFIAVDSSIWLIVDSLLWRLP